MFNVWGGPRANCLERIDHPCEPTGRRVLAACMHARRKMGGCVKARYRSTGYQLKNTIQEEEKGRYIVDILMCPCKHYNIPEACGVRRACLLAAALPREIQSCGWGRASLATTHTRTINANLCCSEIVRLYV
eukprot:scaffold67585_cov63-Phaeocystis_antarctica.AAC.1